MSKDIEEKETIEKEELKKNSKDTEKVSNSDLKDTEIKEPSLEDSVREEQDKKYLAKKIVELEQTNAAINDKLDAILNKFNSSNDGLNSSITNQEVEKGDSKEIYISSSFGIKGEK